MPYPLERLETRCVCRDAHNPQCKAHPIEDRVVKVLAWVALVLLYSGTCWVLWTTLTWIRLFLQ